MKIASIKTIVVREPGWLKDRFGDHFAQISNDTTMKLRSAVKDVCRVMHGRVPPDVELFTKDFVNAPQGISDHDFVFGYDKGDDEWVGGSIETDSALKAFIAKYPKEWDVASQCLGLTRQKGRHACFPAGELISIDETHTVEIEKCQNQTVQTGQGNQDCVTVIPKGPRMVKEYLLENGKKLRCTPDHLVLTATGEWVEIEWAFVMGLELMEPKFVNQAPKDSQKSK